MKEDFCLYLLSNVSPETFPANKAQRFSTLLAKDIYLTDEWEVGLRNIMYPTEISSATEEDKINFYKHTNLDRTDIVPFRRNKYSIADDVPLALDVKLNPTSKIHDFVNSALKATPGYHKKQFYFDYTAGNKFILVVPIDNVIVEMNTKTAHYLGLMHNLLFTRGSHWAWSERTAHIVKYTTPSLGELEDNALKFWVYDLTYYENDIFKMTYDGNNYVCHELGLEMQNGQIIDRGKVDFKFFILDSETQKLLNVGHEAYTNWKIFKKGAANTFYKLNSVAWRALKPEVTVWYNRLKEEVKTEEVVDPITLNTKVDLKDTTRLLTTLNQKENEYDYSVSYNESTHRFKLEVGNKYSVCFSPSLWSILGFNEKLSGRKLRNTVIEAEYFPALDRGIKILILYSNIVEASFIGNTEAPLLAICPFEKRQNDDTHVIQKEIVKPIYVPLNRNILNRIDISIHDEAGASIPFTHGKTFLTLHFRKIR